MEKLTVNRDAVRQVFKNWREVLNGLDDGDAWMFVTALRGADIFVSDMSKRVLTCSIRHETDRAMDIAHFVNTFATKSVKEIFNELKCESAKLTVHYYSHITDCAAVLAHYYRESKGKLAFFYEQIGDLSRLLRRYNSEAEQVKEGIRILTDIQQTLIELGVLEISTREAGERG